MRKLLVLMKLSFRALLSAMKMGNSKKSRLGGMGALLLFSALALYISGIYSFAFGDMLFDAGLERFLIPLISLIGLLLAIVMTMNAAGGFLFSGKDSDLMLSLPVSAFSIMLAKILALYIECFVFCAFFLLPSGIAYLVYGGAGGAMLIIRLLIATLILPFLATLFCTILAYIMSWVSSRTNHNSLVSTVLMFVMMGLVMVLSFQINKLSALLTAHSEQFDSLLNTWLLPIGLMEKGIMGNWLALLGFAAICILPFLAVVWLFSTHYKKILSGLAGRSSRNDYKLGEYKANSCFSALFKKEIRRYFGTTIYFFNTGFGGILLLAAAIYAVFAKSTIDPFVAQMGGVTHALPMVLGILCMLMSTINTTCVSISLEGKTLWILKEAPISASKFFASKLALNLLVAWTPALASLLLVGISYGFPIPSLFAMLLLVLAFGVFVALSGLFTNLMFPKMDCDNEAVVVKQSASAITGIFGGLAVVGIGVVLYFLLKNTLSLPVYCLLVTAILLALCAILWRYLTTAGAKKLVSL
ncbi:MAG: hypothetical protein RSG55_04400 [Oscillospiraceae bacterium]